ncbi:hypothetical protein SAMN02927903_03327 [Flavobacterium caeni]|uniref:Uncharacterized protein n=2 Tax=Flavobacterium caeni TaxID=490189 RepID=A0A1G5KJ44_9FLAO|nr:hypothetical protein SAMN02927903_03327 [Flavobacterium caeni]
MLVALGIFVYTWIVFLADLFFPGKVFIALTFNAIISIIGFLAVVRFSTSIIQITIDEFGITKTWIKQLPFQNRPNTVIEWNKILQYKVEPSRGWIRFKFIATNGEFQILHRNHFEDDFDEFVQEFETRVTTLNQSEIVTSKISRIPNIYEGRSGLIILSLAILILLITVYHISTSRIEIKEYFALSTVFLGAAYFILQVLVNRPKR